MQNNAFRLLFNGEIYKIPPMFKHIVEIPLKISESLIFSPTHQYEVESKVTKAVFLSFIEYIVDDRLPDININNIHEFLQLSQEFNLLEEQIKSKMLQLGEYLVNLNGLQNKEIGDVSFYEEQIAVKLDDYLSKYGQNLMKSPIQSLFNIFNHQKRKLTNYDLAYELIQEHFKLTNDFNIFILLESIDGTKLSKSHLEESILLREKRMNHMPLIQFNYLANAIESQEKLQSQINELNSKLSKLQKRHEIDLKNLVMKNESDKKEIMKMNEKLINDLNEKFESSIKQLIENNENNKKEMIASFQSEIKKLQEKHKEDIEALKKVNDSLIEKTKKYELADNTKVEEKNKGIDCSFKGDQLSGIISYLKKKYGHDLEKSGVLKLTDPGIKSSNPVSNLFMYNSDDSYTNQYLGPASESEGWFEIDFINKRINLMSYAIRTSSSSPNGYCHPKSWRIVGSNDKKKWDVLDHRVNDSSLNGSNFQNQFTCKSNEYYRYIRYIQEDAWYNFKFNICLSCVELFGYIRN